MLTTKEIDEQDQAAFNQVATHPLQSWEWGEFRRQQGHQLVRLGLFEGQKLKAGFQISFHQASKIPFSVGYLPKSSLPNQKVVNELKKIGRQNNVIFIKIEPDVEQSPESKKELEKLGLRPAKPIFTKYTSLIDLDKSEEELLKSFKSKTRYNIRLAQRHNLVVKEDNSDQAFENYLNLLFETTKRQGFYAHNKNYHRQQWQILKPAGIPHLLTAQYQDKVLAAFLLFVFNQTLYYPYGASSREHKELMAPTLLMWEAIRFGKSYGCTRFDLWGDIEPNPAPNHPYYGFHRFKEGFSPRLVEFVGTYDLVINPILYRIYNLVDKIRWTMLRLKTRLS